MSNSDDEITKNRKTSLFKMAAKVAFKQSKNIVYRAAEDRLKNMVSQADVIVKHVGKLKGAAMKAVQMITIEGRDFLPPEVIKVLETLQSQSQPLSNEEMMKRIRQELGEEKFNSLQDMEEEPIAAASIGQVYRAKINGQPIVIKVQYPGIAESVDSDISALKKLIKGLMIVYRKKVNLDEIFDEVTRILKLETDYEYERDMAQKYSENFSDKSGYRIPKVIPELTTKRVITSEYIDGLEFTAWLEKGPSKEKRLSLGQKILDLYNIEFFENRLVQTDPNPANFLVDSDNNLVLLDFGATIAYDVNFTNQYLRLLKSVFRNDENLIHLVEEFGFIDPREDRETKKDFVDFIQMTLQPFRSENQPFDFSSNDYVDEIRSKAMSFSRKIKYSAPPKKLIFLHRKLGGIFQLLRMLEAQIDLIPFVEFVLNFPLYPEEE